MTNREVPDLALARLEAWADAAESRWVEISIWTRWRYVVRLLDDVSATYGNGASLSEAADHALSAHGHERS